MRVIDQIHLILDKYITEKGWSISGWQVENPKDKTISDYATNISFKLAGPLKSSPLKIADELTPELSKIFEEKMLGAFDVFSLRGFINFKLKPNFCFEYLLTDTFSKNLITKNSKVLVEYVSANPTGPLHIGHGRWAAMGDSLKRIMEHVGY
ncbi:MAG: arginine--tRNA ligase [Candidatus Riflemargulisbacteria bacterium]